MQWALLAIVIVALFLMSGRYPKLAFGTLGVIVLAAIATILLTEDESKLTRNQITPSDIVVLNTAATPAYGGSYRLSGRLQNQNTDAALKEVVLSIVMQDCTGEDCLVVGQSTERINLQVPPGQARDFSVNAYLGEPAISGTIRWSFDITDTRG